MARKKPVPVEKEEPLFVGVANPINLRRNLLESSKGLLSVLKQMEKIKEIRAKKKEGMDGLHVLLRDVKNSLIRLRKKVPAVAAKVHIPEQSVEKKEKIQIQKQPQTELDKLEAEIAYIESKLKRV